MTLDLTGGIDATKELFFATKPDDAEMRDSASFWFFDERGAVGFPRICIETIGGSWNTPDVQVNVAFPDGRIFRLWEHLPNNGPELFGGGSRALSAGPLSLSCVEPFRVWAGKFDGSLVQSSSQSLLKGETDGNRVRAYFEFEATMVAPPWIMGQMSAKADNQLKSSVEGLLMGGPRYEQMCRVSGLLGINGIEQRFSGSGLRVRRQGVRRMAGHTGHCMQSALFPSGKAFGCSIFAPRPDGQSSYNEGFIFTGNGALVAATVVKAPWMSELRPDGDDASVVLETKLGTISIEGRTVMSTFDASTSEIAKSFLLHQGGARYSWDGEVTYGMIERATQRAGLQ